jgi:prephenate dehydrogenase
MDDPDFMLEQQTVAIVGLGLMGGSLAMALKGYVRRVLGVDRDPQTVQLALQKGIVDQADTDLGKILPIADLIILATPVGTILDLITLLPNWKPDGALVIDLGSTKTQICKALQTLPIQFTAVGGHPMCGKETSALEYADASMFDQAPFVLVELKNSDEKSMHLVESLVKRIGAIPFPLDAKTHDHWVAYTSHFPYLLSNLLARITPTETKPLVAGGWRSTTRLAASSVPMMKDILVTNREMVLQVLDEFMMQLREVRSIIEKTPNSLNDYLSAGQSSYLEMMTNNETQ